MIRPETDELKQVIAIVITTAPKYALRSSMSSRGKLDWHVAVKGRGPRGGRTRALRVDAREPTSLEVGRGTLALFPGLES